MSVGMAVVRVCRSVRWFVRSLSSSAIRLGNRSVWCIDNNALLRSSSRSLVHSPGRCSSLVTGAKYLGNQFSASSLFCRNLSDKASWEDLTYEDLQALFRGHDLRLIDVREKKEIQETGTIPNSINIPLGQIKDALRMSDEDFAERYKCSKPLLYDTNIVFYGLGPIKSRAALEIAKKLGFSRARHYSGGWEDYTKKTGQPLSKTA